MSGDNMDELRRQVESLTAQVEAEKATEPAKKRWNPFRSLAASRRANKEFYEQQRAATPTDSGTAIGWVIAVLVIGGLLWAVSSWWLDTMKPANETQPTVAASETASATTEPTPVPTYKVDGDAPQAAPGNTVPAPVIAPLPAPLAVPADPANAESVMRSLSVAWLSRSGNGDSWRAAATPWVADGMAEKLGDAPMVRAALTGAGDTAVQAVDLVPAAETADTPTRITRQATVTVANTTGAPLVIQLGYTAYLEGTAWKVAIVEETSFTRKAS